MAVSSEQLSRYLDYLLIRWMFANSCRNRRSQFMTLRIRHECDCLNMAHSLNLFRTYEGCTLFWRLTSAGLFSDPVQSMEFTWTKSSSMMPRLIWWFPACLGDAQCIQHSFLQRPPENLHLLIVVRGWDRQAADRNISTALQQARMKIGSVVFCSLFIVYISIAAARFSFRSDNGHVYYVHRSRRITYEE